MARWTRYAEEMRWVELADELVAVTGELAGRHPLSGADATHLASGLALGADHSLFVTWDRRLWSAAHSEQLAVAPRDVE